MANTPQRSFAGGEVAPALHARADLARYAIGLRTCRNMVVMRAGGATKRPGTKFVNTAGITPGYILTLTPTVSVVAPQHVGIVALLTDWLGNPVTLFPCTFETDNATIATVAATGSRTANVTGVADGTVHVRARIAALGLVSNDCVVTSTDYYILHGFAENGTFTVTQGGSADHLLMIAGGGSGGSVDGFGVGGGGGGAGELLHITNQHFDPGGYPVIIGGGGVAPFADHTIGGGVFGALPGANGTDTTFNGYRTRGGGGGGGSDATLLRRGRDGGSGGGGASAGDGAGGTYTGGSATAVIPGQGSVGSNGINSNVSPGGGGGGAGGAGSVGGGGAGIDLTILGSLATFARGGDAVSPGAGTNGSASTGNGGGGGGGAVNCNGGNGGSGVVYIKYKASTGIVASGGIMTTLPLP